MNIFISLLFHITKLLKSNYLYIQVGEEGPFKRVVWIDGGIHAREWISPATNLILLDKVRCKELAGINITLVFESLNYLHLSLNRPSQ